MRGFICSNICIVMLLLSIFEAVSGKKFDDSELKAMADAFDRINNQRQHDIVFIDNSHPKKRDVNGDIFIKLKPFGENIELWLKPVEGVLFSEETPIFTADGRTPNGPRYTQLTNIMKDVKIKLYEDKKSFTSLAVSHNDRNKRMVGVIGEKNYEIWPLPESFINNKTRLRRHLLSENGSDYDFQTYHIISRRAVRQPLKSFDNILDTKEFSQATVYPEILVIVDYPLYKKFSSNVNLIMYLMAFWNGVDLIYRDLENPRFRLNIAGVIIATKPNVLEYMAPRRGNSEQLDFNAAIDSSTYWLYKNVNLEQLNKDTYDVAVTMTPLTFVDKDEITGEYKPGTLGIAYVSGTCTINERRGEILKTALVHDTGVFDGVETAAHELGHSFGASHDGEGNNKDCETKIGNIMLYKESKTKEGATWSKCSLRDFEKFLKEGKCIRNIPKTRNDLIRLLPGQMVDANEQCKKQKGTGAYVVNATTCLNLQCNELSGLSILETGPAAEGTTCGDNKICLLRQCVDVKPQTSQPSEAPRKKVSIEIQPIVNRNRGLPKNFPRNPKLIY